ncbi:hypothetical protein HMPREF3169_05260 [Corynebacterium sp. HMSC08C04]|uniref:hypothetical protein n=1 Tax=Corynebacterium sp. HMSC08C04 TaxID=1581137 RepID=UPI0008A41CD9|nr:hypothetical protein [Corynebacterium sp. HMSC08C04]OFT34652.1 hypothetical protein HMPREF3169_05260 [Corynebacterium sp. HMSC08C04]
MLNIDSWNLNHPKAVLDLLEAQEKLNQIADSPAPDRNGLFNAKTVEKTLNAMVEHSLRTGPERLRAITNAQSAIQNRIDSTVAAHLDNYLEQARGSFDDAANAYYAALEELPVEPFTAHDVINFSKPQREAYDAAREAAGTISHWIDWSNDLRQLPGQGMGAWTSWNLVASPQTVGALMILQLDETAGLEPAYQAILPTLAKAIRDGAELRLATPAQAKTDAAEVEAERQEMSEPAHRALRTSLGY